MGCCNLTYELGCPTCWDLIARGCRPDCKHICFLSGPLAGMLINSYASRHSFESEVSKSGFSILEKERLEY